MDYIKTNKKGYTLHLLKTKQFKTTTITVYFRNKMEPSTVTSRSLLPFILKASTDKYKTKREISKKLQKMYGCSLSTRVTRIGEGNVISFNIRVINDKFLKESNNLVQDSCNFLNSIIKDHSSFSESIIEEEKRLLNIEFEQEYNNKSRYSLNRLIHHMLNDEKYKLRPLGIQKEISSININNITNAYNDMLNKDCIDVVVSGDLTDEQTDFVKECFDFNGSNLQVPIVDLEDKSISKVTYIQEFDNISQGKLNIGYRTNIRHSDRLQYAITLYSQILGESTNSLLFTNVRELHSLAYSIESSVDLVKGLMFIYAGISHDKYEKALKLIREQLSTIKENKFDHNILETSKLSVINNYKEAMDTQNFGLSKVYIDKLKNEDFNTEKVIEGIKAVTVDDIIEVANNIEEDTVYFLTSKGGNDNE